MYRRRLKTEDAEYRIYNDNLVLLDKITKPCYHFIVNSEINSSDGQKYKIIGFSDYVHAFNANELSTIISFDESSMIEEVTTFFILLCKSTFFLSPKIKRIKGNCYVINKGPNIITNDNEFVSVINKNNIINHFPLELLNVQISTRSRLIIRETIKIIGFGAFGLNMSLIFISLPSSVEIIEESAFGSCLNLRSIIIKKNSKLRIIGKWSFNSSKISQFVFPSSIEEIGAFSFFKCNYLTTITFQNNSRLRKIGRRAFNETKIKSIDFPTSLEEIGEYAFNHCGKLSSVVICMHQRYTITRQ